MSKKVEKIINDLSAGVVPFELHFDLTKKSDYIDWSALSYDDWNTNAFWYGKQPEGLLEQFPELIAWVDQIAEDRRGITPLMELEYRQKQARQEETLKKLESLKIQNS